MTISLFKDLSGRPHHRAAGCLITLENGIQLWGTASDGVEKGQWEKVDGEVQASGMIRSSVLLLFDVLLLYV